MASSSYKTLVVTLVAIAIFSSFCEASFHDIKDASLLDIVCRQTNVQPFYEFCIDILKSDPRALTSNLTGLARVALELDIIEATTTLVSIDDMARSSTNDGTTQIYLLKCSDLYDIVLSELQQAVGDLDNGMTRVKDGSLTAGSKAQECESMFNGPPVRISPISSSNAKINDLGIIVAAIIDLLRS